MPPYGGTSRRMKKVVLWLLYTVNTGRRRGQHPERMTATAWYQSKQGLGSFAVADATYYTQKPMCQRANEAEDQRRILFERSEL